jgi:CBS domain containing-hemolysin-like protein
MIFNIFLTLFFVFLNGFFVAAEFAIVKVRSSQIELRIRTGSKLASISKNIIQKLDVYLAATQLGITMASLGLGWIGESVVTVLILDLMRFIGIDISPQLAHKIALPLAFATITCLHIIFGEQAPKSLAILRSEQVTLMLALPLRIFYLIFKPIILLLNFLSNRVIILLGFERITEEHGLHSSEEIRYLLEESSKSGIIAKTEHKLLENVFEFSDTPVKQIMVPHNKIVAVEIKMSSDDIMNTFIEQGYSRLPVYKDSIDNIIGIIYAKDMISMLNHRNLIIINDIIRLPFFVGEDYKISRLLHSFQKERNHIAIVLDEFGGTAGIVTMEDILEEIVGEIQDEYDEEQPSVEKINDNEFVILASSTIGDTNDFLPVPLPESEDYESVGGLIMNITGRIPETNEIIPIDSYSCKILKRSKRNIEKIKLTYIDKRIEE